MLAPGGTIWFPSAECTPGLEPGRRRQNHRAVRNHMHPGNRQAIQDNDPHDLPENLQPPQKRRTQWNDLHRVGHRQPAESDAGHGETVGVEGRLEIQRQERGSVTAYIVEDDEFERFCRDNLNYLIFMVGGRVAPRERILFLKQFVIAADMPDDHTARSHRREREAYAQLIDSEEMTN